MKIHAPLRLTLIAISMVSIWVLYATLSPQSLSLAQTLSLAPQTLPFEPTITVVDIESLPPPGGEDADRTHRVVSIPNDAKFYAPKGFVVEVFAEGLVKPRWMALTPSGELLVTEEKGKRIKVLRVSSDYSSGEVIRTFADSDNGIDRALGMGFLEGSILIANTSGISRFDYQPGQLYLQGRGENFGLRVPVSGYNNHWTRNLVVDRVNRRVFLSVGSGTNREIEEAPRGTIVEMDYAGEQTAVYASGLRNPIGFDLHPETNALYSTVTERDHLGDELVPDFFTLVQRNGFYGWPFAYLRPDLLDPKHTLPSGESTHPAMVAQTLTPDVLFKAHSTPIGFSFARGDNFPAPYDRGGFVALRGSWNKTRGVGFEIAHIPFDENHRPSGGYQSFVKGFHSEPNEPEVWGRPAGILFLPDGSMLFSDDGNGENDGASVFGKRIYRVRYVRE
jgi:glucose/arabinose dehydrogenase